MKKKSLKILIFTGILTLLFCNIVFASGQLSQDQLASLQAMQVFKPDLWSQIIGFLNLINFIGMFLLFHKAGVFPLWVIVPFWGIKKQGDIAKSSMGIVCMISSIVTIIMSFTSISTIIQTAASGSDMSNILGSLIAQGGVLLISLIVTYITSLILNYQTVNRFTNVSTLVNILGIFFPGIVGFSSNSNYKR